MSIKRQFEVDFIPKFGVNHDFMKIYNRMGTTMGNIVLINNLLNLLEMREGLNKEFPTLGLANEFLKLSFVSIGQIDNILGNIQNAIRNQLGHDGVDLSYTIKNPESPQSDITVKISIDGIPGSIDVDVINTLYNSKAIATKYSK